MLYSLYHFSSNLQCKNDEDTVTLLFVLSDFNLMLCRSIVVQYYLVYIGLVLCKPHDKDIPCQWSSKTGSSFGELT